MENKIDYFIDTRKLSLKMSEKFVNKAELSRKSCVSRGTIGNIFKGKEPTGRIICSIASALDLSVREATDIFFSQKFT